MKKIDIDKLDVFQLFSLKEILDNRCEYYTKSIPNYALLVGDEKSISPEQREMLAKYNVLKAKSSTISNIIEKYMIEELFNEKD